MKKVLVILGPTSTGKTDLALRLAEFIPSKVEGLAQGELVSCDSRQVYVGLDIGTGKAPSGIFNFQFSIFKKEKYWELDGIKIWMYDVVNPKRQYTVYDYVQDASRVIGDILKRGKLPIIVGGTGLYLKALLEGLPNLAIPRDLKLRKELERLSLDGLQKRLQKLSPERWEKMNSSDRQNPRRLIRAIEIVILNPKGEGSSMVGEDSSLIAQNDREIAQNDNGVDHNDILKIGLIAPREVLYKRIDERVVSRIDQGMIDEARKLHKDGLTFKRMKELGLEYGVLADYLSGKISPSTSLRVKELRGDQGLVQIMQGKIHGFARRQITWFKKEENVFWFDITDKNYAGKVENLVAKWYDNSRYATKN